MYSDYNKDGVTDTLTWSFESGSAFSSVFLNFKDGTSGDEVQVDALFSFGSFLDLVPIPNQWSTDRYADLRQTIGGVLSKDERIETENNALRWLLSTAQRTDGYWNSNTDWSEGFPSKSLIGYAIVKREDLPTWLLSRLDSGEESSHFWLIYYGHNHFDRYHKGWNKTVLADGEREIWYSKHGLVLVDLENTRYKWLFISQEGLTGSPSKLRWQSISEVEVDGDIVTFRQSLPVYMDDDYLWTIDLNNFEMHRSLIED
ncbi:MAG: hypothetical protein AAF741_13870 [Bacteroidota bacterium]